MRSQVVLVTVGSLGDLHPFISLGLALRELGIDVLLVSAEEYRDKVEKTGLGFRAARPSFEDMQSHLGMTRAELTQAVLSRADFLFRKVIVPHVHESYDDMVPLLRDADLVLTSSLAFGARLAAERLMIPWIGVVLQPLMFMSIYDPPEIPQARWLSVWLRHAGPRTRRLVLGVVKHAVGHLLKPVHVLRHDIGLPPTLANPVFEGQFGEAGAIGLYSPLLGPVQRDYPPRTSIVGFAFFDSEDGAQGCLAADLEDFLLAGDAPLVFTLGSLIVNSPGSFFRESIAAACSMGRRAVLLVGSDAMAQYANCRSESVFVSAYAPHSLLFPRAAAIVHQGGAGTLAQALRAGRPQLIVPFYADQMDNARRAAGLEVARVLLPHCYERSSAVKELEQLLENAAYASHAARVAGVVRQEDGARQAAVLVSDRLELKPLKTVG